MNGNLFITYDIDDWDAATPFASSEETRRTFEDFYGYARRNGIDTYRANIGWFDTETLTFRKAWTFHDGNWEKIVNPPAPDAIWDRIARRKDSGPSALESAAERGLPVFNPPVFRNVFDNKLCQYLAFRRYMPESFLAQNHDELLRRVGRIAETPIVLKQTYGSGGKQVEIRTADDVADTTLEFPVLVQRFVETAGIPGFPSIETVADLRIVYVGRTPIYAVSRQAMPGSLLTNIHQGASGVWIPLEDVPARCLTMADEIAGLVSEPFDKPNYSLDFMFTKDGDPILIEINTSPGFNILRMHGDTEARAAYYAALLRSFFPERTSEFS